jgi:Uma2 family endonuclease
MTMAAPLWGTVYDLGEIPLADLVALNDDGTLNEIWEGRLVQETVTYPLQGFAANQVGFFLATYLLGVGSTAQVGQRILFDLTQPGQPRMALAPDVVILPSGFSFPPRTVPTIAPQLAVEILSPTQAMMQMRLKARAYLHAGSAEAWIVDPEQVTVEVITPQSTSVYAGQQPIVSTVLAGFVAAPQDVIP